MFSCMSKLYTKVISLIPRECMNWSNVYLECSEIALCQMHKCNGLYIKYIALLVYFASINFVAFDNKHVAILNVNDFKFFLGSSFVTTLPTPFKVIRTMASYG